MRGRVGRDRGQGGDKNGEKMRKGGSLEGKKERDKLAIIFCEAYHLS